MLSVDTLKGVVIICASIIFFAGGGYVMLADKQVKGLDVLVFGLETFHWIVSWNRNQSR